MNKGGLSLSEESSILICLNECRFVVDTVVGDLLMVLILILK